MLRYEMPVVYHLLRRLCATQQPFEPDWPPSLKRPFPVPRTITATSSPVSYTHLDVYKRQISSVPHVINSRFSHFNSSAASKTFSFRSRVLAFEIDVYKRQVYS